jgi:hypothetical protein
MIILRLLKINIFKLVSVIGTMFVGIGSVFVFLRFIKIVLSGLTLVFLFLFAFLILLSFLVLMKNINFNFFLFIFFLKKKINVITHGLG